MCESDKNVLKQPIVFNTWNKLIIYYNSNIYLYTCTVIYFKLQSFGTLRCEVFKELILNKVNYHYTYVAKNKLADDHYKRLARVTGVGVAR